MGQADQLRAWERFYGEVVTRGTAWPRERWFRAVCTAVETALGERSEIARSLRHAVDQLLGLEKEAKDNTASERIAALESEIRSLLTRADEKLRTHQQRQQAEAAKDPPAPGRAIRRPGHVGRGEVETSSRWSWPANGLATAVGMAALVLMLFAASAMSAFWVFEIRLRNQVELEAQLRAQALDEAVAAAEKTLDQRLAAVEEARDRALDVDADVTKRLEAFASHLTASLARMENLEERAAATIQARFESRTSALDKTLAAIRGDAGKLQTSLDAIRDDIDRQQGRLPQIAISIGTLNEDVTSTKASVRKTIDDVKALRATTPKVTAWAEKERANLEKSLANERQSLAALDDEISGLADQIDATGARLQNLERMVEEGGVRARAGNEALDMALREIEADRTALASLLRDTRSDVSTLQARVRGEIDRTLSDMAEKADLALLRGKDALDRAESDAVRRIGERASSLESTLEGELERLKAKGEAGRNALASTQNDLVESWEGMGTAVSERHRELMADLDQYADAVQVRVRAFLEAVEVMVAQTARVPVEAAAD